MEILNSSNSAMMSFSDLQTSMACVSSVVISSFLFFFVFNVVMRAKRAKCVMAGVLGVL